MSENPETRPSPPEPPQTPAEKKIMVIALGGSGAKTLNAFSALPGTGNITPFFWQDINNNSIYESKRKGAAL